MKDKTKRVWNLIEKLVRIVLQVICKLIGKELTDSAFANFMGFIKFGIVGVSNTVISYAIYASVLLCLKRFHLLVGVDYMVSQCLAFILSVLWSFYWNNKMVFVLGDGQKRSVWKSLLKTFISYSFTGLLLSGILLVFWVRFCGISEFIAPVINLAVTIPLNFIINKKWAFKSEKE